MSKNEHIINGIIYHTEENELLCEIIKPNPKLLVDLFPKVQRLYYCKGKNFVLVPGKRGADASVITDKEASIFMNEHSSGINKVVYAKYFGKPKEI